MSTLLTAVEIANCLDNGGGRVVWQHQSCRMVSVEKRHCMDRSGGHEGCGLSITSWSTAKMELGCIDSEGHEAVNCTNNSGGSGQPQTC